MRPREETQGHQATWKWRQDFVWYPVTGTYPCPVFSVHRFKLKGGREICALKTIEWVQDYLTKKKILRLKGK